MADQEVIAGAGLDPARIPRHVGIIMDGNGRWAQSRGLDRTAGHARGEPALFDVVYGAVDLGIEWLTVYAFSTENWNRPDYEVEFLMHFNRDLLRRRRDELNDLGVEVHFIGERHDPRIPDDLRAEIAAAEDLTRGNRRLRLVFAFNYGGRMEIAGAARAAAEAVRAGDLDPDAVDVAGLGRWMYLPEMPDVDLVVRTSGERRTSNFLLWQSVYAEYVFTPVLWPDFDRTTLADCVREFQGRHRRFGGVVEGDGPPNP
jgi:undecaprenyl diphosphate synthase